MLITAERDGYFGLRAQPAPSSLWPIPMCLSSNQPPDAAAIDVRDLLANLADFSMIRRDAQKDEITVHRVVQEILRTQQKEPVPVLTAALNMLNAARPEGDPADVRTWPQWELLRPHVAFVVAAAEKAGIGELVSDLMGALAILLSGKALHAEAEPLMRRALAIDEQSCGAEHPNVARDLNNLAMLLKDTNRMPEAVPLMRRAVAIFRTSLGDEHPNALPVQNNLDLLLADMNRSL